MGGNPHVRTAYLEELGEDQIEWLPEAVLRIDLKHAEGTLIIASR